MRECGSERAGDHSLKKRLFLTVRLSVAVAVLLDGSVACLVFLMWHMAAIYVDTTLLLTAASERKKTFCAMM